MFVVKCSENLQNIGEKMLFLPRKKVAEGRKKVRKAQTHTHTHTHTHPAYVPEIVLLTPPPPPPLGAMPL